MDFHSQETIPVVDGLDALQVEVNGNLPCCKGLLELGQNGVDYFNDKCAGHTYEEVWMGVDRYYEDGEMLQPLTTVWPGLSDYLS